MATEQRLIDANKVAQDVRENNKANFFQADWSSKRVCELLESAPIVDAVEVVRCKECLHHEDGKCFHPKQESGWNSEGGEHLLVNTTDFCSYGERKNEQA